MISPLLALFPILAFIGGGIRGAYQNALVARLLKAYPKLLERARLLPGTSVGALSAAAYGLGLDPEVTLKLFREKGALIFGQPWWRKPIRAGYLIPKFGQGPLRRALEDVFGDMRMDEFPDDHEVLVTTYDLRRGKAKVWDGSDDVKVVDALLTSSAAPFYLPPHMGCIDGGMYANDPSLIGVVHAIDKIGAPLRDLRILTIGTGSEPPKAVAGAGLSAGGASPTFGGRSHINWGAFINVAIDAPTAATGYMIRAVFNSHAHLLNPSLGEEIPLDAAHRVEDLIAAAQTVDLGPTVEWLQENWR